LLELVQDGEETAWVASAVALGLAPARDEAWEEESGGEPVAAPERMRPVVQLVQAVALMRAS
jgi:hypothetical protein